SSPTLPNGRRSAATSPTPSAGGSATSTPPPPSAAPTSRATPRAASSTPPPASRACGTWCGRTPSKPRSPPLGNSTCEKSWPGPHDDGGWLPDGGIAINKSGRPEPVLTHDQWQALLESRGCGPTFTGDIHVTIPARDLAEMQQVAEFFARLQQEARRHGARTRVGAPR